MDLISREKAINSVYDGTSYDVLTEECKRHIEEVPSAFEGMTNGEVFLQTYPAAEIKRNGIIVEVIGNYFNLMTTSEWWDSPYKGVSE